MKSLPLPKDQWCNCNWFPRIICKARHFKAGTLPKEYLNPFCHPAGVDGQFLSFFELEKEQIIGICDQSDSAVQNWFLSLTQVSPHRIDQWNTLSLQLGKEGFPMHERFEKAITGTYKHVSDLNPTTVFEVLEADETQTTQDS